MLACQDQDQYYKMDQDQYDNKDRNQDENLGLGSLKTSIFLSSILFRFQVDIKNEKIF